MHPYRRTIVPCVILVCGLWNPVSMASNTVNALDGMSVYGNRELPKALTIVPWKPSQRSASNPPTGRPSLSDVLMPLDRDVFMRRLMIHETVNGAH